MIDPLVPSTFIDKPEVISFNAGTFSLILFSPFVFLFKAIAADMTYVLLTCFLMVALSSIPDLDVQWEIKHRGITHIILFGIFVGILFSILIGYAYGPLGLIMGFVAGFGATSSHLLGDAFTYMSFKPFYPFSQKEVSFGFFEASDKIANRSLLIIGIIVIVISYEPSIITQIMSSMTNT